MKTKDTLLILLARNRGFFISGEYIAQDMGVSRTAVWKSAKKLQSEGYKITAITNRGYCLSKETDLLCSNGIAGHLSDKAAANYRTEVFVSLDSTSEKCREKAANGEKAGYTAIIVSQPSPRGPKGRKFYSPADTGFYMSILLQDKGMECSEIEHIAAKAINKSIQINSGRIADIGEDANVYIDDKRVGFTECIRDDDTTILDVGVNIFPPANGFPPLMNERVTYVMPRAKESLRNKFIAAILNEFAELY